MSTQIILDACSNHMGDRRLMEEMIKQAANIGADFIKFQSFIADKLNPNWPDYEKSKAYYKSVELSDSDHFFILEKCREHGVKPLFTAFNSDRARFLKSIGMDIVKIASPDADNTELVNYCIPNFETVLVSSGMTTLSRAKALRNDGCHVLYCISKYPAKYEEIDFDKMQLFDGFSDHTPNILAAKKAVDLGTGYIERHFTLGKYLPGKDHFFSSTPDEIKELVDYRNYVDKCKLFKTRWTNG
jgi:N,N'-diacetyllegionaminate synthase